MKKLQQVVIRIHGAYTAKNTLQKLILENLKPLQHGFVPDLETARYIIQDAVKISHVQCKTKCTPMPLVEPNTYEKYCAPKPTDYERWHVDGLVCIDIMNLHKL